MLIRLSTNFGFLRILHNYINQFFIIIIIIDIDIDIDIDTTGAALHDTAISVRLGPRLQQAAKVKTAKRRVVVEREGRVGDYAALPADLANGSFSAIAVIRVTALVRRLHVALRTFAVQPSRMTGLTGTGRAASDPERPLGRDCR
ncbi:hypothetical protein [Paraburkholderia elongata]|uniref:Uncharacterized protein n=1 Tax=Paraburkholderia elongata TaxID=2675747 RepID=A0A972NS45_9BURK|nr:hypothetical protein [Paraburkholderia elongata]NPT57609.1 hypothetical protein [Paraburkholderia elongata]